MRRDPSIWPQRKWGQEEGGGGGDSTPPFPGTKSFVYFKSESKKLSQKSLHVNNK